MHAKALDYFMIGLPLLFSTGLVGGIIGTFYYYLNLLIEWTKKRFYSAVIIRHNDDTFKWVLKFMQEKGYAVDHGNMKC